MDFLTSEEYIYINAKTNLVKKMGKFIRYIGRPWVNDWMPFATAEFAFGTIEANEYHLLQIIQKE